MRRTKGVKGPEQSLVRESRSDEQPDGAEERKERKERSDCSEERSGVRKIVELAELRRFLERRLKEERQRYSTAKKKGQMAMEHVAMGKCSALVELLKKLSDTAEKRSDLPNETSPSTGATGNDHE